MDRAIRVRVLGREYALRVREEDEHLTREIAAYVDAKMQAFKKAHPEQPELTTAVVTALAIAEELYTAWEDEDELRAAVQDELAGLAAHLDEALTPHPSTDAPAPTPAREETLD